MLKTAAAEQRSKGGFLLGTRPVHLMGSHGPQSRPPVRGRAVQIPPACSPASHPALIHEPASAGLWEGTGFPSMPPPNTQDSSLPVQPLRFHLKLSNLAFRDGRSMGIESLEDFLNVGAVLKRVGQVLCHTAGHLDR